MSRIGWEVFLPLYALALLALSLLGALNMAKFNETLKATEQHTFGVLADDLKERIELGISMGLPLASFGGVTELFERTMASNPAVLATELRGVSEELLFDVDRSDTMDGRQGQPWPVADVNFAKPVEWGEAEFVVIRSIENPGGLTEGYLGLVISTDNYKATQRRVIGDVAVRLAIVALVIPFGIGILIQLGLKRIIRALREDARSLETLWEQNQAAEDAGLESAFLEFSKRAARDGQRG